jgi:DNA-binding CsgD family transcriptional regulator
VFSQYIETRYTADLLGAASGGGAGGVGYLLKDRVGDVEEFVEALSRVAAGGTALDPEVVMQLLGASRRNDALTTLTPRERDVLALMAEGRSNAAIAEILVVSDRSVEKHVGNIFSKLGLAPSDADHRRVLAVLRYVESLPERAPDMNTGNSRAILAGATCRKTAGRALNGTRSIRPAKRQDTRQRHISRFCPAQQAAAEGTRNRAERRVGVRLSSGLRVVGDLRKP